jgi:hypothetical protein
MAQQGFYRRTIWLGLVSTALGGGCYTLPTAPPPAGPRAAAAVPQPAPVTPAAVDWPPTTLPGPAAVAVADSEEDNHAVVDEAARSRAELQRLKQEILSLRERLGNTEKENLETIRSIVDALDQVLEQDRLREPKEAREEPAELEPPQMPRDKPDLLPQLPPLKRNG